VIGQLMGLPEADWAFIHRLAEQMLAGQDPEVTTGDGGASLLEMAAYAMSFAAARRREEPRPDLTTVLLNGDFGGHVMTDADFGSFFVQLVGAGNDTTKTMTTSGVVALLQHPDQLAELRADPGLTAGAVEEILRWANPIHYMRRTAMEDTRLGGTPIAAGQKVAMYYTSANRDEAVFTDPQRFDIRRHPNPHLSFGIAEHFCLGVHLARLEGRVFFEELLDAFDTIELTGEPVRLRSNLNNAYRQVPIRLGCRGQ
jgi:cytochrome P450